MDCHSPDICMITVQQLFLLFVTLIRFNLTIFFPLLISVSSVLKSISACSEYRFHIKICTSFFLFFLNKSIISGFWGFGVLGF